MALTSDFTFKLGNSGVELNTDVSLPFVDITSVSGLDNAAYRETERDHEGDDGGFMDAEFEKGRRILLTGDVYCDTLTMETYLDALKENYAPSTSLVPFYLKAPGVSERYLSVKPLGCKYDWETVRRTGQSRIQFSMYAEDPRIYDSALTSLNIPFATGGSLGFGFNLSFNFGFGGSAGSDGAFVNNTGNRPTPVIFTINGPSETPTIRDDTHGHALTFNISLAAGETLVVNTQYKTVLLNGATNRRGTLVNPDWFFLPKGQTFLRYNALTGTGSSMDVAFHSAWR
jgi:hypothetical protein